MPSNIDTMEIPIPLSKTQLKALLYSYCFRDLSVENLKYLTSRQAIEDIAEFIRQKNEEKKEEQKWIVVGGSYAGVSPSLSIHNSD